MCAINWDNRPNHSHRANKLKLIRTPRAGKINAVILSTHATGVWTHYFGNRTIPCLDSGCQGCEHKRQRRQHCYVSIWFPEEDKRELFECTAEAGHELLCMAEENQPIRGRTIRAWRTGRAANSPVEIELGPDLSHKYKLPPEPDVPAALRTIWHLTNDPAAYGEPQKKKLVQQHWRREKTDGSQHPANDVRATELEQSRRSGSTNGVHQPNAKTGDFPEGPAFEPTHD